MVYWCAAINCTNTNSLENRAKRITFHRFPWDRVNRTAWALATRRQGSEKGTLWKPSKYSVLCSKHFLETDFIVGKKLRKIKPGVIPTVFDFPGCNIKSKVPVTKQSQNKASENGKFTRKETLPSSKKKTVTLPSFNIQDNSNVIEYDEVSNIKAIKFPVILLSQKEASKYTGTLPIHNKETAPFPSFNIQEHFNMIEYDKVSDIKAKIPVIQQSQKNDSKNEKKILHPPFNFQEHSYIKKINKVSNIKSKDPVIKQGQNKASKNGKFTRKKNLHSPEKKTVTLPSFNIQDNSNMIEYDEVSNIKANKFPVILLSQKEASKYTGTLPSQNKETAPLPSFNIQEHFNTIECDKVSDIKAKLPVIQQSQKKISKNEGTLPSQKEKTLPLCSIIVPTSSNIQEHSNEIECDKVINMKKTLEAAESKFENAYKKLCTAREVISRKERRIQKLLNNLEEQKTLYESVKDRVPAYTDRSTDLQIELITRKPGIPYSEEMKTFAKTLREFSPKAYDFLRDTLNLPSDRTLRQRKDNIDDNCTEFHTKTFQVLEEKSPNCDTGNNYCRLMFDGKIISGNRKVC